MSINKFRATVGKYTDLYITYDWEEQLCITNVEGYSKYEINAYKFI